MTIKKSWKKFYESIYTKCINQPQGKGLFLATTYFDPRSLKLIKFVIHRHIQLFDVHISMQFNLCATTSSACAYENAGRPLKLRVSTKTTVAVSTILPSKSILRFWGAKTCLNSSFLDITHHLKRKNDILTLISGLVIIAYLHIMQVTLCRVISLHNMQP